MRDNCPRSTGQPKLTLIVCTYNNAASLGRTLEAFVVQDVPRDDWTVIVVDNNSSDATATVIDNAISAGSIPGLYRLFEPCQGLSQARRAGVAACRTEWLAFIDDDCTPEPDFVSNALAFAASHHRAGAGGGRIRLRWERNPGTFFDRYAASYAGQDYGDSPRALDVLSGGEHLVGAALLLRRDALLDSGWMGDATLCDRRGAELTSGGDTEIVYRIARAGWELHYRPELRAVHHIPATRMTVPYLCRLQRGFGRVSHIARCIQAGARPGVAHRILVLGGALRRCARLLRSLLLDHLLARRPIGDEVRVGCHRRLGELEGAWRFLLRGVRR